MQDLPLKAHPLPIMESDPIQKLPKELQKAYLRDQTRIPAVVEPHRETLKLLPQIYQERVRKQNREILSMKEF
jgi:hypothetical protein